MFKNLLRKIQIYLEEIKGPRDVHVSILSERKLTCYITDISTGEESMVEISCKTICHDLTYLNPLAKKKRFKLLEYKMKISDETTTSEHLRKKSQIGVIVPDYYENIVDCNEKVCLNTAAYLDVLSKNDS